MSMKNTEEKLTENSEKQTQRISVSAKITIEKTSLTELFKSFIPAAAIR